MLGGILDVHLMCKTAHMKSEEIVSEKCLWNSVGKSGPGALLLGIFLRAV